MKIKPLYIILAIVVVIALWMGGSYNGLVKKDEGVATTWSNVQSQYQRRADLIPNLVRIVQGVANFEKSTITAVTEARASVGQIKLSVDDLSDPDKFAAFTKAQDSLSSALSRLLVVSENYPNLKSNENFSLFQSQLEGTENRIVVARDRYNESVEEFNVVVRRFPGNIIASMFGFETKQRFEAEAGADKAPQVKFE